ncbi:MAG: hypothetical protein K2G70_01810 [Turicibacter sp.]|nr:hypothetical protein [Turicibacter sp.]
MINEKGAILPLTVAISLIIALLLLNFSYQIQNQGRTYELEQQFLTFSFLEKECIATIIDELKDPTFTPSNNMPSKNIPLSNQTVATINYTNGYETLAVTYKFIYNDYLGQGTVEYNKKLQTYHLK